MSAGRSSAFDYWQTDIHRNKSKGDGGGAYGQGGIGPLLG